MKIVSCRCQRNYLKILSAAAEDRAEVSQPASHACFCGWFKLPKCFPNTGMVWKAQCLCCAVLLGCAERYQGAEAGLLCSLCVINHPFALGELSGAPCMFPCFSSDSSSCLPTTSPTLALPFWEHWSLAWTGGHSWCTWVSEELASWVWCRLMIESDIPEMFLITPGRRESYPDPLQRLMQLFSPSHTTKKSLCIRQSPPCQDVCLCCTPCTSQASLNIVALSPSGWTQLCFISICKGVGYVLKHQLAFKRTYLNSHPHS